MKHLATLAFCAISPIHYVSAWSFIWRNGSDVASTKRSNSPQPCTQINQAKGHEFDFNPETDSYLLYVWTNDNCSGPTAGSSDAIWRHNSSTDLKSFLVGNSDGTSETSSSTTSSAPPSTTSSPTPSQTTASSPATSSALSTGTPSSGHHTLSGGAIAGIVIGAIAAVAIIGAIFFFIGRRRKTVQSTANAQNGQHDGPYPGATGFTPGSVEAPKSPVTSQYQSPQYQNTQSQNTQYQNAQYQNPPMSADDVRAPFYRSVPGNGMAELVGDDGTAEMSDTHRLNELEGRNKY